MRVWIEIYKADSTADSPNVTLHVRVWIEMCYLAVAILSGFVTLHVRVWIEIRIILKK